MATVDYARLMPKGWVLYDNVGTATVEESENVTSVTDSGVGRWVVNWADDFTGPTDYAVVGYAGNESSANAFVSETDATGRAAGSTPCTTRSPETGSDVDRTRNCLVAFGTLA